MANPRILPALLLCLAAARMAAADDDPPTTIWEYLLAKYDKNGDGKVSRKEYDRDKLHWKRLDADGDGYVDEQEAENLKREKPNWKPKKQLEPGDRAPDFKLVRLLKQDGEVDPARSDKLKLSSFRGKRPVALIFGSYT